MAGGGYGMARYGMDSMKKNRNLRKGRKSLKESQYHGQVKSIIKGKPDFEEINNYQDHIKRRRLKQNRYILFTILIFTLAVIFLLI